MRKSNNDSGLTAKRSYRLLATGLTALAVSFASCKTSSQAPLDDAYYWPDNQAESSSMIQNPQNTPTIEYLNVQDTAVTIRIRK